MTNNAREINNPFLAFRLFSASSKIINTNKDIKKITGLAINITNANKESIFIILA